MTRCKHCHARSVYSDDDRLVCFACGFVADEGEPSTLEKILSNVTPEAERDSGTRAEPDLAWFRGRVMGRIRQGG